MTSVNADNIPLPQSGSFIDLSDYSSNLDTLTYNGDGTMDVTFKKNKKFAYRYHHVSPALWVFLLRGRETMDKTDKFSIGAAFHQEVIQKPDLYPFEKVPLDSKE